MAERLFVSRDTLWRLECGDPSVVLGTFVTAAYILELLDRLAAFAAAGEDQLGLELDIDRLPRRIRRRTPGPTDGAAFLSNRPSGRECSKKRPYRSIDYLLAVDDVARIAALRFHWSVVW